MGEADIPDNVKKFLRAHINSLYKLEVLLLLHAKAETEWTVDDVNRELQIGSELVRKQLVDLHDHELLKFSQSPTETYRYNPRTTDLDQAVTELVKCYKERRVSITSFIYSSPLDNVRTFAEAFRLRKDK